MDGTRFDQLIKRMATQRVSRLTALRGLAAGAVASLTGLTLLGQESEAKKDGKKTRKRRICHRTSASDPGVSKKLKAKRAKKHLRNHPFDTKGRCQAAPVPLTPVTPATTCSAAAPVECGNSAFCCPSNRPQCCVNADIAGFSCAPSTFECCGQFGAACAPTGESCCLPDPTVGGEQFTGCIPDGTICCPFAEDGRQIAAAQINGSGRGFCDRREVFDVEGALDFYPSYFCCPPDAGTDFGRCCPGAAEGDDPVEGGCCNTDAADPDADCPEGFLCDENNGCCQPVILIPV